MNATRTTVARRQEETRSRPSVAAQVRAPASVIRANPSAVEALRPLPSDPVHSRNTC